MNAGAFLDRDGTINVDDGYVARPEALEFIPGAVEAIQMLNSRGFKIAVVTNQAGVARGFHSETDVQAFHAEMSRQLARHGAHVDRFYYCPHHAEGAVKEYAIDCECRKPGDALYREAIRDLELDPSRCIAIGDKTTDLEPALALGSSATLLVPAKRLDDPCHEERGFDRADSLLTAVSRWLS